jgi:ketosteroid isomerase-like protein
MSESSILSPRSVILAAQQALLEGDVEAFISHFATDAVLEFPHSAEASLPSRLQGRESIRQVVAALWSRFHGDGRSLRSVEYLAVHETKDPEVVVVEFEALGEARPGTGDYRLPDIQVWRVRDGLVHSVRDYLGSLARPVSVPAQERVPGGSAWG